MKVLSVVVIGRNEGERLARCLESVEGMDRDGLRVEVIYVDSGSSDNSVVLAAAMGARVISLQPERPTAGLGRNAGWHNATGEFVLFLDGDTLLHSTFVKDSMREFDTPGVGVVWGHRRELHPERSLYNRVLDLDWIYAPGPSEFCGGDAIFRRDLLVRTGGFDKLLIAGEEPELCRRILKLGSTILHVDRPMTQHDLAMTKFSQYWRRAARAGHAYAEVSARFAGTGDRFWSAEARRNQVRAGLLMGLACAGLTIGAARRSMWPVAAAGALFGLLALRTAWKARWKSRRVSTLLLYGMHSHFQQIPILAGQLAYRWSRRHGRKPRLMEYRLAEATPPSEPGQAQVR